MLMNITRTDQTLRLKAKFGFNDKTSRQLDLWINWIIKRLGPFTIMKQINVVAFQLKFPNSMKIHFMFHVSLFKPYHASTIPRKFYEPPLIMKVDGEQEYEMEDVFDLSVSNQQF
jgi:hypothetical protein